MSLPSTLDLNITIWNHLKLFSIYPSKYIYIFTLSKYPQYYCTGGWRLGLVMGFVGDNSCLLINLVWRRHNPVTIISSSSHLFSFLSLYIWTMGLAPRFIVRKMCVGQTDWKGEVGTIFNSYGIPKACPVVPVFYNQIIIFKSSLKQICSNLASIDQIDLIEKQSTLTTLWHSVYLHSDDDDNADGDDDGNGEGTGHQLAVLVSPPRPGAGLPAAGLRWAEDDWRLMETRGQQEQDHSGENWGQTNFTEHLNWKLKWLIVGKELGRKFLFCTLFYNEQTWLVYKHKQILWNQT